MALSVTQGVSYARSFTAYVEPDGAGQTITNANLLTLASTTGGLRTLLSATYGSASSAQQAFRNAGGSFALRLAAGTAITTSLIGIDGNGLITIALGAGDNTTKLEMSMRLLHTVDA